LMIGLTFSFIFNNPFHRERFLLFIFNNPFHRERFLLLFHINLFIFLKKMFLLSLSSLKLCNFAEKF
ncbi:hypothetical protein DW079_11685, partial [Segatella copri]